MADYIDTALIAHALKQTTITNIIGQRLYHIKAPQRAPKPYVVLNIPVPSGESEEFGKLRMGQPTFQWTCVSNDSKTPCDAYLVSQAILDAFSNYQGTMEDVVIKIIWGSGQPKEIPSTTNEDIICIAETEVHYEEP